MNKIVFPVKIVSIYLYNAFLSPFATVINKTSNGMPSDMMWFLVFMMFIPETAWFSSKSFREWIQKGIEDGDGKLNKSDMKDMLILYGSLWCLRIFMFMSWAKIFYSVHIEMHIYIIPLIGSFGISGIPLLKMLVGKK